MMHRAATRKKLSTIETDASSTSARNSEMPLLAKIDQLLPLHAAEKNCFPASQNAAAVRSH